MTTIYGLPATTLAPRFREMMAPAPPVPRAPVADANVAQRITAGYGTGAAKLQKVLFESITASREQMNGRFDSRVDPSAYEMALRRTMGDIGKENR